VLIRIVVAIIRTKYDEILLLMLVAVHQDQSEVKICDYPQSSDLRSFVVQALAKEVGQLEEQELMMDQVSSRMWSWWLCYKNKFFLFLIKI